MFDSQNRKMNFGLLIILKSDSIPSKKITPTGMAG